MSETVTMTLTEFLLARIAEDESVVGERGLEPQASPYDWPWTLGETDYPGALYVDPRRVLAECEAKRRIVDYREQAARESRQTGLPIFEAQVSAYDATLRALALPYADHPDYDESWRP